MMEIFGHDFIENSDFFTINSIEDIKNTAPNSLILMEFDKDIIKYAKEQNLPFGVKATSIKELVLSCASNATYILVNKEFSKTAQKIANEYMYDAKMVLVLKKR